MQSKTHSVFIALIVLCSFTTVMCQDWTQPNQFNAFDGTQLQHVFSDIINIQDAGTIDFTSTYTLPIPEGIFDSTENIYIVLGLFSLEMDITDPERTLFVESAVVTAQTLFTISIKNQEDVPGAVDTPFTLIEYSVLLIGSEFQGFASPGVESSYIYGKFGDLETIDPLVEAKHFKFDTGEGSPFDYVPDAVLGQGCGMIRKGGKLIIQIQLCEHSQLYGTIVGFVGSTQGGATSQLSLSSHPSDDFVLTNKYPTPTAALFKSTAASTDFGPIFHYPAAGDFDLTKIQVSFLFIGIRNYNVGNYPNQPPPEDGFLFYAKSGFEAAEGSTTDPFTVNVQDPFDNIGNFAHLFCGIDGFQLEDGQNSLDSDLNSFDSASTDISFSMGGTIGAASYACLLIRSRQICEDTQTSLILVATPDRIQLQSNFGVEAVASGSHTAVSPITPTNKFTFQPAANTENTMTLTMTYDRSNGDTAFQASLLIPHLKAGDYLKITIFGEVLIEATLPSDINLEALVSLLSNDVSMNQVVIEYVGNPTTPPGGAEVLGIAIESYDNVLSGLQCLNACPSQVNMDVGINADTPPSCIYCDTTRFLHYDHLYRNCACMDRYVDNSGTCEPCFDPLCVTCADSTVTADCTLCVVHATEDGAGVCNCNSGYYPENGACVACLHACVSCSSATLCSDCVANDDTRDAPENGCVCLDGYYEDGESAICPQCSVECLTCVDEASKCTSCRTLGHFELVGTTCRCIDGYYELRTDTDATCQKCDDTCLTCETSSLQCTSCDEENDFRQLTGDKKCECKDGFAEIAGECIDENCQSVTPHCQSCAYDPFTQTSECLDCTANRYLLNSECVCKVGFYEKNGNCEACGSGCQQCEVNINNQLTCLSCALKSIDNLDGTCTCPGGTILVEANGAMYCRKCSANCLKCEGSFDYCSSCADPLINNNNGDCLCPEKTYPASGNQCLPCLSNCNECNDGTTCEQCASGYVGDGSSCDLDCPDGTYKDSNACVDCPTGCKLCLSSYHCTECEDSYFLYAGSCRPSCPQGTFALNGHCYNCVSPCKACSGSGENCESCISTKVYLNGKCLDKCPDGTFFGDGSCLLCDPRCLTCTGTSTYCKSCVDNKYFLNHNCFDQCPGVILEGQCSGQCPDGKYLSDSACKHCDEKCATCETSSTNCLTCANGFKSHDGNCVGECPHNYLDKGTFCIKCSDSCHGCTGAIDFCDKCATGFVRIGKRCRSDCPPGQYIDYQSQSCQYCGEGCKLCTSLAHCSVCIDPYLTPLHGICKKGCPIGAKLIGHECVCTFGFSHLNICVSSCPERFYASHRKCQPCQSPCKSCSGSASSCLNCENGFDFDPSSSTCSRKSKCKYGEYEDQGGTCRRYCQASSYFYQTACLSYCPSGYKDNGYGGCVEITNPSICQYPQYQQGSSCVSACQVGHYGNTATRICEKCRNHCFLCLNYDHCLQCVPGYVPIDGSCVPSLGCNDYQVQFKGKCLDGCPVGTYKSGVTCKAACLPNRYYYGGFCYSDCPTKHRTDEACVDSCAGHDNCV